MKRKHVSKDDLEIIEYLFEWIGIFNHHDYFTKELYRNLNGRKDVDEAEVKCAFLHAALYNKFGICSTPAGCGWFKSWEPVDNGYATITDNDCEKIVKDYLKEWKDVFDDYYSWCEKQR